MSTPTSPQTPLERQVHHNRQVLEQALDVAQACQGLPPDRFSDHIGPHLRHLIEHYDALLFPVEPGVVDYDHRPRDRALETEPDLAVDRLRSLMASLDTLASARLDDVLVVRAQVGLWGQWSCEVGSTLGRELVVLSSHAVHHFALLRSHCQRHGLRVGAEFGMAPSTLAHAAAGDVPISHSAHPHLESPCPAF